MKRSLLFISILVILPALALSGCAGVDASVLDTAECMGKGVIGAGMVYTMGIHPAEWLEIDPEDIFDSNSVCALQYVELEYGLADDIDSKFRFGIMDRAKSGKLLVKKQINKEDKISTAFVFGAGAATAGEKKWEPVDGIDRGTEYMLLSGEAQMLMTRELKQGKYLTFALRGNYHQLTESFDRGDDRVRDFYNGGLRVNYKRYYKGFYSVFEIGIEAPLSVEDLNQVYPWIGMKFCMDTNKKHKQ